LFRNRNGSPHRTSDGAEETLNIYDLKAAYEEAIGHSTNDSTVYNVLNRHDWRRLMPRPYHPARDIGARERHLGWNRNRGQLRGAVCGAMTAAGGLGHTLPYLIPDFFVATVVSVCVVAAELAIISFIGHRFMDTPFLAAAFQVVVGGVLVFIAGIVT
jgi:VIT1/CCC1 family predicted Fe2+/Mn2+ transporter